MAEKIGLRDPANTASYFAIYESKNGATGAVAAVGPLVPRIRPAAAQRPHVGATRAGLLWNHLVVRRLTRSPGLRCSGPPPRGQ